MAQDLDIEKISDQEIRIRLSGNNKVKSKTVSAEELYEQLGKYLHHKKTRGDSPITADCVIDYA